MIALRRDFVGYFYPKNYVHLSACFRSRSQFEEVKEEDKMKVLNVAEKNDAAKNISQYLSGGNLRRREGLSKFNKIYEFTCNLRGQNAQMIMTSVSGHMLQLDFTGSYKNWRGCSPLVLFDAPVEKFCPDNYVEIKRTLEREIRGCNMLIIWTDCDREGENIGFEIIDTCKAVRPNIQVFRAKFSEITAQSVHRAIGQLEQPNKLLSDAVDVRSELDLRIGAAFTRFQTLRLQQVFPQNLANQLISYGSCQFPTLGFVVERFKAIQSFIPEQFWKIVVNHTLKDVSVDFSWKRVRLFNELACQVLLDVVLERQTATVEKIISKPKSKWRPLPLDTIELEKLGSRKLKLNAKETMKIAERLYTQGYISYPRTETNIFPKELNLRTLVEMQIINQQWGAFAQRVVEEGPNPRQGKKSDQAHPPIHPTKYADNLQGNESKVYEFIVRHFLACCSKDAQGHETIVDIDINGEKFVASGLMIIALNYLEVYPYEKWSAKEIHTYQEGQTFEPSKIEMLESSTSAPKLLTEADLIALMEKHGIGTDATHAEHIETIKNRMYVGLENTYFLPGQLGLGLVDGYDSMGFPLSKPNLRAGLEADLKCICEGTRNARDVLAEQLARYKAVFEVALQQARKLDEALSEHLNEARQPVGEAGLMVAENKTVRKCPACGLDMVLKSKRDNGGFFISCMGFPRCRSCIWLPGSVESVDVANESCSDCGNNTKKLKFQFRRHSYHPFYPDSYTGCVGGCDEDFLRTLGVSEQARGVRGMTGNADTNSVDSGFGSSLNNTVNNTVPNSRFAGEHRRGPLSAERGNTANSSTNNWSSNTPGQDRNFPFRRPGDESNSSVMCQCQVEAVMLVVRKDGPNQGRSFYKCGNYSACNFFMWADENDTSASTSRNTDSRGSSTTSNPPAHEVLCSCGQAAKRLTVSKDGPNKGRPFFACPKPRDSSCKFFMWGDEESSTGAGGWNDGGGGGGGGGVAAVIHSAEGRGQQGLFGSNGGVGRGRGRGIPAAPGAPKARRKCGICGQEGHVRTKCPNR